MPADKSLLLLSACRDGRLSAVRRLVKRGVDVNQAGKDGYTPVHIAAKKGHLEIVQWLVKVGADANQGNQDGTPVTDAAFNRHLEIVQCLVKLGADVNYCHPRTTESVSGKARSATVGSTKWPGGTAGLVG